eukprot:scaffold3337_cov204-Alexandrium_tamarense.AAC.16
MFATAQSLQGFIYWDSNADGIFTHNVLDEESGVYKQELENGVVDVRVGVRRCGDGGGGGEGHSPIYPGGGYWRVDLGEGRRELGILDHLGEVDTNNNNYYYGGDRKLQDSNAVEGCFIKDSNLSNINSSGRDASGAGCYLVVSSPKDYEITSSFPLPSDWNSKEGTRDEETFHWMPFQDMDSTSSTTNATAGGGSNGGVDLENVVNRGYQARTAECFGYHAEKREWYVWNTDGSAATDVATSSGGGGDGGTEATPIAVPNDYLYSYDSYLDSQPSYDHTLSITPLGMLENSWPLPLRVKSDLVLGLRFDEDPLDNTGRGEEDFVWLNDRIFEDRDSSSEESGGGGGGTTKEKGVPRFQFLPTSMSNAVSSSTFVDDQNSTATLSSYSSSSTVAEELYTHTNTYGILPSPSNLQNVLETFLTEMVVKANQKKGNEMQFVNVDVVEEWSMVKVLDKKVNIMGRGLRGALLDSTLFEVLPTSSSDELDGTASNHLRGGNLISKHQHQRRTEKMIKPHLVFELQAIAKYNARTTNLQTALSTTKNFGTLLSNTINRSREDLIAKIRQRSGYRGLECNPKSSGAQEDEDDGLVSSIPIAIGDGGSVEDDVIEIDLGVVNRFDCDQLLPLYYYDLEGLAARVESNSNRGELAKAVQLLSTEDGFYDGESLYAEQEGNSPGGGGAPTVVIAVVGVVCALLFTGGGWVVYERRRRKRVREKKRLERALLREMRKLDSENGESKREKKQRKHKKNKVVVAESESEEDKTKNVESKVAKQQTPKNEVNNLASDDDNNSSFGEEAADNSDDDDSELDRLFAPKDSTSETEIDNHDTSKKSGLDHSEDPKQSTKVSTKKSLQKRINGLASSFRRSDQKLAELQVEKVENNVSDLENDAEVEKKRRDAKEKKAGLEDVGKTATKPATRKGLGGSIPTRKKMATAMMSFRASVAKLTVGDLELSSSDDSSSDDSSSDSDSDSSSSSSSSEDEGMKKKYAPKRKTPTDIKLKSVVPSEQSLSRMVSSGHESMENSFHGNISRHNSQPGHNIHGKEKAYSRRGTDPLSDRQIPRRDGNERQVNPELHSEVSKTADYLPKDLGKAKAKKKQTRPSSEDERNARDAKKRPRRHPTASVSRKKDKDEKTVRIHGNDNPRSNSFKKLHLLKSSLTSSLKGKKLSNTAASALDDTDLPHSTGHSGVSHSHDDRRSKKARSVKSSRSQPEGSTKKASRTSKAGSSREKSNKSKSNHKSKTGNDSADPAKKSRRKTSSRKTDRMTEAAMGEAK